MHKPILGLKAWIKRINDIELPALASVIHEITHLTHADDTHVEQLAQVILRDTSTTSHILRIANSVHYNLSSQPITTISRAVIHIGFEQIKQICLSVVVIDSLLNRTHQNALHQLLAQSFHAAVQARNLAKSLSLISQEEVFVAALLHNLGELAFLSCGGEQVTAYQQALAEQPQNKRQICLDILGVGLNAITKQLARQWDLGELLLQTLEVGQLPSRKVLSVRLGCEIAKQIHTGLGSAEMIKLISQVSQFLGIHTEDAHEMVLSSLDEASSVAATYGAERISHLLPNSQHLLQQQSSATEARLEGPAFQLKTLQRLTELTLQQADINRIFQTAILGIHQGIGLQRVAIAVFDLHKTLVEARYVIGAGTEHWRTEFRMPVNLASHAPDIFSQALIQHRPIWLHGNQSPRLRYAPLSKILASGDCTVAPLGVDKRWLGVCYADSSGEDLSEKQFHDFTHVVHSINLAVALLIKRNDTMATTHKQ